MAKTAILYRLDTMDVDGVVSVSNDEDLAVQQYDPATHGLLEVDLDHPVTGEQHAWRVKGDAIERKAATEIAQIEEQRRQRRQAPRGPSIEDLLLEEINELRAALKLPLRTMAEVKQRQEGR